jgi:calcineurin-like phosphoesterase family protein
MLTVSAFYSDPHLGHANIIKYCERPFADVEEMNQELVRRYNDKIGYEDVVLWLGDCFFKGDSSRYSGILSRMNGTKILIVGNHDNSMPAMARLGFALVFSEAVLNIRGVTCRVNHYPYKPTPVYEKPDKFAALRPRKYPGEILIHGHNHVKTPVHGSQINVGVDAWDYGPALFHEVADLVDQIKQVKPEKDNP